MQGESTDNYQYFKPQFFPSGHGLIEQINATYYSPVMQLLPDD